MNQLIQQEQIQQEQKDDNQNIEQLQQQNEDEEQKQTQNENAQQNENEGLDQAEDHQDQQKIEEQEEQHDQKKGGNVETKRMATQGEMETTTQRKDQNRRLETEKYNHLSLFDYNNELKQQLKGHLKHLNRFIIKEIQAHFYIQEQQNNLIPEQFMIKQIDLMQNNNTPFPKLRGFPSLKRVIVQCSSMIHINPYINSRIQTQLSKRSAALGFGIKSDFTKRDKYIPGPTDYNVKLQPKPGVKFAYGRDETLSKGLHGRPNTNPAPNLYQVKDIVTTYKYSMGERTSAKHIYLESTTPAPGRYNVGGFSQKGNYFIGKYKSSGAPVISPSTAQSQRVKKIPGPGTYDPPGDIGDPRNYLPSQYSTRSGFRFGYQERQTQEIKNKQFPGPGTYQIPSEFGDFEFPPAF